MKIFKKIFTDPLYIFSIVLIMLGIIGYCQALLIEPWPKYIIIILTSIFILGSLIHLILNTKRDIEKINDIYKEAQVEAFYYDSADQELDFFTNNRNEKCVKIKLLHQPIESSIELWEGGYKCPPITYYREENSVVFINSAYTSIEEYKTKNGPIYSIKYFVEERA